MKRTFLPRAVIVLGLVSFCNDLASDMVIPLIPVLLAGALAAGPVALGLVEGLADTVASFLKLWSGRHSDLLGGRRKAFAATGYALSNAVRPLLGLAGSWVGVLLLRATDRMGKGVRSAPRDALLSEAAPEDLRGRAFGFHRAMDNGGAVLGSLAAAAAIVWLHGSLRQVILLSALPGAVAVLLIVFAVRDPAAVRPAAPRAAPAPLRWGALAPSMRQYLLVLGLFAFARASETFIVLRGHLMGLSTPALLLLWAALNLAKAATNTHGGQLSDRLGRRGVLLCGWIAFGIAFWLLAAVRDAAGLWAATLFYGLFTGLTEGAERALIGDLASPAARGTAFGWYNLMTGVTALPAGLLFGAVWHYAGAPAAFAAAGSLALAAAALFRLKVWPQLARAPEEQAAGMSS